VRRNEETSRRIWTLHAGLRAPRVAGAIGGQRPGKSS